MKKDENGFKDNGTQRFPSGEESSEEPSAQLPMRLAMDRARRTMLKNGKNVPDTGVQHDPTRILSAFHSCKPKRTSIKLSTPKHGNEAEHITTAKSWNVGRRVPSPCTHWASSHCATACSHSTVLGHIGQVSAQEFRSGSFGLVTVSVIHHRSASHTQKENERQGPRQLDEQLLCGTPEQNESTVQDHEEHGIICK